VRIDQRTKNLSFGTDLGLSSREEAAEGPTIQAMPSEQIRNQLTSFGILLSQAVAKINPRRSVSFLYLKEKFMFIKCYALVVCLSNLLYSVVRQLFFIISVYFLLCEQEEEEELKANILNSYRLTAKKEHNRILQRRQVIEERKEQLENLNEMRVSCLSTTLHLHDIYNSLS
jgi:translation initiation factor 3 subunit A